MPDDQQRSARGGGVNRLIGMGTIYARTVETPDGIRHLVSPAGNEALCGASWDGAATQVSALSSTFATWVCLRCRQKHARMRGVKAEW